MTFEEWYTEEGFHYQRLEVVLMKQAWDAALLTQPEDASTIAGLRMALAKAADTMRDAERVFRLFNKDTAAEAMRIAAEHSRDVLCGRERSEPQKLSEGDK